MVKQHEINSIIARFKVEDLETFLAEGINAILKCRHLIDEISNYRGGEMDEDELLDVLDEFHLESMMLSKCSSGFFSVNRGVNHYLRKTVRSLDRLVRKITTVTESGCYPTDNELDIMLSEANAVVAGLSYILVFEFEMKETLATVGENTVEDEVVFNYRRKTSKTAESVVKSLIEISEKYKIKLEFFDSYPDLEEPFEAFMGPYLSSINPEHLTIELVTQLLAGEITAEEMFELVKADELEEISCF